MKNKKLSWMLLVAFSIILTLGINSSYAATNCAPGCGLSSDGRTCSPNFVSTSSVNCCPSNTQACLGNEIVKCNSDPDSNPRTGEASWQTQTVCQSGYACDLNAPSGCRQIAYTCP